MDAHPGIVFRDGPAGRRAVLIGGPDVWEVIKAVRAVRDTNRRLKGAAVSAAVHEHTGVNPERIEAALAYYGEFADEIDERLAQDSALEAELLVAMQRRTELLGA